MWQETVLALANAVLVIPLLPTVLNSDAQVPRWTSAPTGACLFLIGVTYVTLGFFAPASTAFIQTVLWIYISVKRPVTDTNSGERGPQQ